MANSYTPGPWEARRRGTTAGYGIYNVGSRPSSGAICRIEASEVKPTEGNARLIAAAPELLETLKTMVSWIENCDWSGCGETTTDNLDHDLEAAYAAMAKAEGVAAMNAGPPE